MGIVTQIDKKTTLPKRLNVAAYARVSCEKDSMLHSLMTQVSYFSDYIQHNKSWNYVGVYSDYGISGTKVSRGDFDALLEEAKKGNIDLILVKSISRFARNLELTLTWIRTLKAINVAIYFELERINTLTSDGELLISLLSASAQEQSKLASKNVLWRVKQDFENGIFFGGSHGIGYKLEGHKFVTVHEESEIVKRIYELYLDGYGDCKIAIKLNDEGIKSPTGKLWHKNTVRNILLNYNYTGDLLLQKTYRLDYISKAKKQNKGEKDMYLVENDHEAIVTKEAFNNAKELRKNKPKPKPNYQSHLFSGLLICNKCGRKYKFVKRHGINKYSCPTYNELGKKYCDSKDVPEAQIIEILKSLLDMNEFNIEIVKKKIDKIVVLENNQLAVHFFDGTIKVVDWCNPSRSSSWTPEMKEQARERLIKQRGDNNA